ncbi:uncharacterized [Tachysurus ichikawai]
MPTKPDPSAGPSHSNPWLVQCTFHTASPANAPTTIVSCLTGSDPESGVTVTCWLGFTATAAKHPWSLCPPPESQG